jgi:pyruvate formate lyase activating enzyme
MVFGNHSELRLLNQKKGAFSDENTGVFVREIIKSRLEGNPNFSMTVNPTGLIFDNVEGYNVLGIHGEVRNMPAALKDFSQTYNTPIDILIGGHMHHYKGETVGIDKFDISLMEKSVEILMNSDVQFEFRTTVTKNFHTVEDIEKISEWIKGTEKYYLQNFVDSGNLIDSNVEGVSKEEMQLMLERIKKYVPTAEIRGL